MILSVVIPCCDERQTLGEIVSRVLAADTLGLELDVIIVDDGSGDGSFEIARALAAEHERVRVFRHPDNRGKGAAVGTGIGEARGDIVLIQDADLEYNPADYAKLLKPIIEGRADVVYGSRFRSTESMRVLHFWHWVGNKALTLLSNMLTGLNLTDIETGYKVFRKELLERIELRESRFGFEPEVTAKMARLKPRFYEVGIGYDGRTYEEGKKITWKDGLWAIWCIVRYNVLG